MKTCKGRHLQDSETPFPPWKGNGGNGVFMREECIIDRTVELGIDDARYIIFLMKNYKK